MVLLSGEASGETMKHIQICHGDLLQAPAEALVNTVNCVGVMGKGIALQFERTFPAIARPYREACRSGRLQPGELQVVELQPALERRLPLAIVNFATKDHWRGNSKIEWIEAGLVRLVAETRTRGWRSIAVPPLGCGNGGLDWNQVRPLIESAFAALPEVAVFIYPPEGAPEAAAMAHTTAVPPMTLKQALYIRMLSRYSIVDLEFSQLELQKLAYFFQEAGEPLRLRFSAQRFGPAAREIYPMLRRWEGHWTIGFGDGSGGLREPIMLRPEIVRAAEEFLKCHPASESQQRVARVLQLIEGFDTAAGLELLATVHWVARHDRRAVVDWEIAAQAVHNWNDHKRRDFPTDWIRSVWQRLHDKNWMRDLQPVPQSA